MNRYFKMILGAGLVLGLASCNQKAEFYTESFVSFDNTSIIVDEDAGTLNIPVYAYTKDGDFAFPRGDNANLTVTFEVVDGTAKKDVDFSVEPANGLLTFDGTSAASIKINVTDNSGVRTGDKNFIVRITGASGEYTLGGAREASVTIKDIDHPLASILGTYSASGVCYGTPYNWTVTLSPDESDESVVWVDAMTPFAVDYAGAMDVYGVVSKDLKTISFPAPQETSLLYDDDDPFVFCEYMGDLTISSAETNIVMTSDNNGGYTTDQGVIFIPLKAMSAYMGAFVDPETMKWTKQ